VIERLGLITDVEKQEKIELTIKRLGGILQKIDLEFSDPKRQKLATHEETYALLQAGKSLEDIAEIRGIKASTVFSHIEKLAEEGKSIDLAPHRPVDEERLSGIHGAFLEIGTLSLSPVREFLASLHDEDYTYDELRMARLFLSETDRKKIEEVMLYESE
jgi:ATP-dependent DNA helicase RecQ